MTHVSRILDDLDLNDKEEALFRKGFYAGQARVIAAIEAVLAAEKYRDTTHFRVTDSNEGKP